MVTHWCFQTCFHVHPENWGRLRTWRFCSDGWLNHRIDSTNTSLYSIETSINKSIRLNKNMKQRIWCYDKRFVRSFYLYLLLIYLLGVFCLLICIFDNLKHPFVNMWKVLTPLTPTHPVIQYVTKLYPRSLEVTNNHWKGHVFTIPKRSRSQNCQAFSIYTPVI